MGKPDDFLHTYQKNATIDPTAEAIEPYMSPAGTYLWVISDSDIAALRAGRLLVFCMEDFENVLIQWRGELETCPKCGSIATPIVSPIHHSASRACTHCGHQWAAEVAE